MKKNKLVFCLIGESGSGKSTIAKMLEQDYDWNIVKSYTTRPQRSEKDTDHIFVTEEEFDALMEVETPIAYTCFDGYRYCATKEQVSKADLYIIDPAGFKHIEKTQGIEFFPIYLDVPETTRADRMLFRGDSCEMVERRIRHDKEAFEEFKNKPGLISVSGTSAEVVETLIQLKVFLTTVRLDII